MKKSNEIRKKGIPRHRGKKCQFFKTQTLIKTTYSNEKV
jgi:hypothetical protein